LGTLESGKLADVLVVDGDVIADISLLEDRGRFVASCKVASSKPDNWRTRRGEANHLNCVRVVQAIDVLARVSAKNEAESTSSSIPWRLQYH